MRWLTLLVVVTVGAATGLADRRPAGNAVIRGRAGPSDIVVTTTARLAGAIHSVTWNGKEFIDSTDHGRQLQSAASFGTGDWANFWAEQFNPTEAGSRRDGVGPRSSSRLLGLKARGNELTSVTRAAFWLAPGETSGPHPARNTAVLSDYLIGKHVTVGYKQFTHAIDYRVTFTLPPTEKHTLAQFEAVTGYMPAEFSNFWTLDEKTGRLAALDAGPGEQAKPVVFSTRDGNWAMGVWSPDQPSKGHERVGYGRFQFPEAGVVKWNCVFRRREPSGLKPGPHSYRAFVAVGTLRNVRDTLVGLMGDFRAASR